MVYSKGIENYLLFINEDLSQISNVVSIVTENDVQLHLRCISNLGDDNFVFFGGYYYSAEARGMFYGRHDFQYGLIDEQRFHSYDLNPQIGADYLGIYSIDHSDNYMLACVTNENTNSASYPVMGYLVRNYNNNYEGTAQHRGNQGSRFICIGTSSVKNTIYIQEITNSGASSFLVLGVPREYTNYGLDLQDHVYYMYLNQADSSSYKYVYNNVIYNYQGSQYGEVLVGYLRNVGGTKKIAFIAQPNEYYSCYNPISGSSNVPITPVNLVYADMSLSATFVIEANTIISTNSLLLYPEDKLTQSFSNYAGSNACKNILQGKQNELKFTSITTSFTCYVSEPCLINVHTIDMENCRYTQYPIFYAHSWVINATLAELTEVSLQGYYNPTYFTLSGTFMPSFTPTGISQLERHSYQPFQIQVFDKCINELSQRTSTKYNYTLGEPKKQILYKDNLNCNSRLNFQLKFNNQNLFPTMITMNPLNGLFYVNEGDVRAAGTHYITIYISYISVSNPIFDNKQYDFTLEVFSNSFAISNKAPYFSPAIIDDENDSVQMSIKYDACQKFVTFDDVQNIFTINPVLKDKGTYNIVITLKDNNFDSKTNQILFQFDVTFNNFSVPIGIITILFEDQLKVPTNYQTKLNRSLDIKLIQQNDKVLALNYSIEEMTSNQMSIKNGIRFKYQYWKIISMFQVMPPKLCHQNSLSKRRFLLNCQNVVDTDEIFKKMYQFDSNNDSPLNDAFDQMGYQSRRIILNLGFIYVIVLFTIFSYVVLAFFKLIKLKNPHQVPTLKVTNKA
eukprot:403369342